MMKRTLAAFAALATVFGALGTSVQAARPIPLPDPVTPTEQVLDGEGLTAFARRLCTSDYNNYYHAVQAMNPQYTLGLQGGQPLWVPDCPVRYSTGAVISTTSTTVASTTSTTSSPTSSTQPAPTSTTSTTPASTTSVVSSTTSTPPAACSGAPGRPGSPDGLGGCFPGPDNTGVPVGVTLTAYTGPCTITVANTVIDAKTIGCSDLQIQAPGVVIRRSHYLGGGVNYGGITVVGAASVRIEDSFIENGGCRDCSVDGPNFTILRTEITGSNRGAWCENTCLIQDSWIHTSQTLPTGAHASAVRAQQYTTLIHNTLLCDYTGSQAGDTGCSADMSGYPDFVPIHHNTITNNLFMANPFGQGFCAYGGATLTKPYSSDPLNATYIQFTGNVFERGTGIGAQNGLKVCGTWGPITDFNPSRTGNVWSNNRYDNGVLIAAA